MAALRRQLTDPFGSAMQCHCTPDGDRAEVCVGFALQVGFDAPSLRLAAMCGRYDPAAVEADPDDPFLSLAALIRKHGGHAR